MPPAIDAQIRGRVVKQWLSGNTRDEISKNNGIGAGTVSNIISYFRNGIESSEFNSIRELAVWLKKEGMTLSDVVTQVRLNNYTKRLGADLEHIESFIKNIASSQEPQKIIDTAIQIEQLSRSIPLDKIPDHIKQKQDGLYQLKEEIETLNPVYHGPKGV